MNINIQDMSNRQLRELIHEAEVLLQDREESELYLWGLEATNGGLLTVEDMSPDLSTIGTLKENPDLTKMVQFLERHVDWDTGGQREEFLDTYYHAINENARKQSMRTTGA